MFQREGRHSERGALEQVTIIEIPAHHDQHVDIRIGPGHIPRLGTIQYIGFKLVAQDSGEFLWGYSLIAIFVRFASLPGAGGFSTSGDGRPRPRRRSRGWL